MTEDPTEIWGAVLPVLEALEELEADYYIGGSVASSHTGVARSTQDADLVADLRIAHAMPLLAALQDRYYLSEDRMLSAIRQRKSFNLIHLESVFKVDVFVMPETPFQRQSMARRVRLPVEEIDRAVDFCSPEDIILNKLLWYQMGNRVSDRQWYDLQGILRIQRENLDFEYLERWACELGLDGLLEEALGEMGGDSG
jgi:hypothetical protein